MTIPEAAAGHFVRVTWPEGFAGSVPDYAEMTLEELARQYHQCTPFEACVGDCEKDKESGDYDACEGALGEDRCAPGYEGNRCSVCTPFGEARSGDCSDSDAPNGYYRLDKICEPCTCTWFTPTKLGMIAFVLILITMVIGDHLLKEVDHMSTVFAPIMIAVTFFQTLGLLLDLDVTWPPALRRWMSMFNLLNVNLQIARPECSGTFGVKERLEITLALPVSVAVLLGLYAAVQYGLSKRMTRAQFRAKHSGRDVIAHLSRQVLTATVASFIFGSIFFLRNVLAVWDCTIPEEQNGPTYVRSEPAIECNTENDEYKYLTSMASLGLTVYIAMFGGFAFGLTIKKDLFEFLGDKFEDVYFYWELILLSRKVLIMMSFLFFASMTEQAWFLGSAVVVASLLLHAAARPYEDELIDWCELLSLLSILFIFQAGVVFKVLNDPAKPETGPAARAMSDRLEWASMMLTIGNVFLTMFVEIRVWTHMRDGEEDYRVRLLNRQIEENKQQNEKLLAGVARAKTLADERAAHRAAMHGNDAGESPEQEFENPVADQDGGDEEKGKKAKSAKTK